VSWKELLERRDVQRHKTSRRELQDLRRLIQRDLADAALAGLSTDRRFATAYNAALQAANMAVACAGYRVTARAGHHQVAFECATRALGSDALAFTDYFDVCRRKRNAIDYSHTQVATETEAQEMVEKANAFWQEVEHWIKKNHPELH
jgi:uncharacterized protein (UPF0332 family)